MAKTYRVQEYGSFVCEKQLPGYICMQENTFNQLEEFVLANNGTDDALELMGISARRGVGKIITAKNYVGVISMRDGTTIEILPKIYSAQADDANGTKAKKLLIEMLKTLRNSPYKSLQTANVDLEKLNIFEVFIRMFINEIFLIAKHGLKCNYERVQENCGVFKGKLLFSQHIKRNLAHKERCYVEYDEFNTNRAENKLIKATLLYLYQKSTSAKNKNDIRTLLNSFSEVDVSVNYDEDFSKCVLDRNMNDYRTVMVWCKVFLKGKSFTSFSGSNVAYALLFPMETLFESYIASVMRKKLDASQFKLYTQDRKYHLFDTPKKFLLKPDIVIHRKAYGAVFVMDTKWKILSKGKPNFGISQPDMYQMYAYQKKYDATNITLLYPRTDKVDEAQVIRYTAEDNVVVNVEFIDLYDMNSLDTLLSRL